MQFLGKLSVDELQAALEIRARSSYVLALPIGAVPGIPGDARPNAARYKRMDMPIWMKC
jgi:hypothetical protein